jgi:hypothetical protein
MFLIEFNITAEPNTLAARSMIFLWEVHKTKLAGRETPRAQEGPAFAKATAGRRGSQRARRAGQVS